MDTQTQMKRRNIYTWAVCLTAVCMMLLQGACQRRLLEDDDLSKAALIKVKIDWSRTGLDPLAKSDDANRIHRVSIRFFPKDGQPVFDLFLETNVTEGKILVPVGSYSVIIFNESVDDYYWQDGITFTDVNSYSNFAANAVPYANSQREQQFPFYTPSVGERFVVEPLHLASWSLEHFEVTEGMVLVSHGRQAAPYVSNEENNMLNALSNVIMRPLTHKVTLTARVENLASMYIGYMAFQGLANKVYMASALTTSTPTTYLFTLNGRKYDADKKSGTTNNSFLSFGRTGSSGAVGESYILAPDVLFITGELYNPTTPLRFDVTDQMKSQPASNFNIGVNISFKLPYVDGAIGVDDWEDVEYTLQ